MAKLWMVHDAIIVFAAALLATVFETPQGPIAVLQGLWRGTLIRGHSSSFLLFLLCGYGLALVIQSRHLNLYSPERLRSISNEQRLSLTACVTSGFLLMSALYLFHVKDIPRSIVIITVVLVSNFIECAAACISHDSLQGFRAQHRDEECTYCRHRRNRASPPPALGEDSTPGLQL